MGISPVRLLPLQHMGRAVQANRDGVPPSAAPLKANEMQLYSYYRPGLVAGEYQITVTQDITATITDPDQNNAVVGKQELVVQNVRGSSPTDVAVQEFEVVVPRFTLDPALINTYYPPDGHQDQGNILPHIVLNDPHYPWEIDAGSTTNMSGTIDGDNLDRNLVPWVALMVFDPDDLRIPTLPKITALQIPGVTNVNQQNTKGTFSMQASQYFQLAAGSFVDFKTGYGTDTKLLGDVTSAPDPCQIIFPTKQQFYDIFHDPETMKYMAHVRNINTTGFPDAGIDEMGLYSVVVSSRTGRFDSPTPCTQICHLVSIENVDVTIPTIKTWLDQTPAEQTGPDRIGLISLFSWVYTALPPQPVTFIDTMKNLVTDQQMFRADEKLLRKLEKSIPPPSPSGGTQPPSPRQLLLDRLELGYTLTRWRTESGEETAAWNRGPLVPQRVRHWPPPEGDPSPPPHSSKPDLPDASNTSKEFQILDTETGLMDLSYSSAWQLGKTLAISDTAFSAALMRFRSVLHNSASSSTRAELNKIVNKATLLKNLNKSMAHLQQLSQGATGGVPQRLHEPVTNPIVADVRSPEAAQVFKKHLNVGVKHQTNAGTEPYNGFNTDPANNSDWALVHNWIADKLSLADIPPHYLIPEPSFVSPEAIRFFYIDDTWMDCLIDGALSVANHLNHDDDLVRKAIKQKFNDYLRTEVKDSGIKPQIPGYGFVLRSQLVKAMPDLRITVSWTVKDPEDHVRHSVCRYTRYDDTTIFCLLDRWPEELHYIKLAQPLHQQRFALGDNITAPVPANGTTPAKAGQLEFWARRLYTLNPPQGEWPGIDHQPSTDDTNDWINWDTRCIKLRVMTSSLNGMLQNSSSRPYVDLIPNSCMMGLELNDPAYFFKIVPPVSDGKWVPAPTPPETVSPPDHVIIPRDRQLYINWDADTAKPPEKDEKGDGNGGGKSGSAKSTPADGKTGDSSGKSISNPSSKLVTSKVDVTARTRPTSAAAAAAAAAAPKPSSNPEPKRASNPVHKPATKPTTPQPASKPAPKPARTSASNPGGAQPTTSKATPHPNPTTTPAPTTTTPGRPPAQPPNIQVRSIPPPPSLLAARTVPPGPAPADLQSQFTLAVYADYRPYPNPPTMEGYDPAAYIPTQNLFFFDLILSLVKTEPSGYNLVEIQIDIPNEGILPKDPTSPLDPDEEPLLQQNYDGAGPRMLANQRFVPFLFTDTDQLRIQLLPRTAADRFLVSLDDDSTNDLSFRLAEANIAHLHAGQYLDLVGSPGNPGWRGRCKVTMVEIYATSAGDWPITTVVEVVKNPIRDAEDVKLEAEP